LLSGGVFQEFIKNVYVTATPGEVNDLRRVAAQQDVILPPAFLKLKQFE
jgi:hypothetical protein